MMKSKLLNSLILAALVVPCVAMAEETSPFSGNVSLTSDYLYRGVSQSGYKGAIQGGFDYAAPNGLYAGAWGSSISWIGAPASNGMELDTYAGYAGSVTEDVGYNVGFLRYNYPGEYDALGATPANTNEIYGSVSWKMLSAKYSRSTTNLFGLAESKGSNYFELNATYTLEGPAVDLAAHFGKQTLVGDTIDPATTLAPKDYTYTDYNVKVSKGFSGYTFALMLSKLKGSKSGVYSDKAESMLGVLSVSHSM